MTTSELIDKALGQVNLYREFISLIWIRYLINTGIPIDMQVERSLVLQSTL